MTQRTTTKPQDGGGFIVYQSGDRIGLIYEAAPKSWAATDTYFVPLRSRYSSKKNAIEALVRRQQKNSAREVRP